MKGSTIKEINIKGLLWNTKLIKLNHHFQESQNHSLINNMEENLNFIKVLMKEMRDSIKKKT